MLSVMRIGLIVIDVERPIRLVSMPTLKLVQTAIHKLQIDCLLLLYQTSNSVDYQMYSSEFHQSRHGQIPQSKQCGINQLLYQRMEQELQPPRRQINKMANPYKATEAALKSTTY